ncbi:hypothetical protein ES708_05537 [subsurface metagenome]
MIEIDQLIDLYRKNGLKLPPISPYEAFEVTASTITYLIAFKQAYELLKRLGDASRGVSPEGYCPHD